MTYLQHCAVSGLILAACTGLLGGVAGWLSHAWWQQQSRQWYVEISPTHEVARIVGATGFVGLYTTTPSCPITIHADDGREACLDWRSGTVTYHGDLPVDESARRFVEALSRVAPWPPPCHTN